jgi:hypothetical protein
LIQDLGSLNGLQKGFKGNHYTASLYELPLAFLLTVTIYLPGIISTLSWTGEGAARVTERMDSKANAKVDVFMFTLVQGFRLKM